MVEQNLRHLIVDLNCPILDTNALPVLENPETVTHLEINFGLKTYFNSIGIRNWIRWLEPLSKTEGLAIRVNECPAGVVLLATMITGFIPKTAEVTSFYLPYYSEPTGEEKQILMKKGHDYLDGKVIFPQVPDSQGNTMEIDLDQKRIYIFLGLPLPT